MELSQPGPHVDSKIKKITVLLDEQEFERFGKYCDDLGFKKSTLVARLIREHLDKQSAIAQQQLPLLSSLNFE